MKKYETACDQIVWDDDSKDIAIVCGLIALWFLIFIWPLPQIAVVFGEYI